MHPVDNNGHPPATNGRKKGPTDNGPPTNGHPGVVLSTLAAVVSSVTGLTVSHFS